MSESLFEMPENPTPGEFNFEGWLQNAQLPERSALVYQRADVLSELADLKRRIELEDRVASDERSAAEADLSPLEKEYESLLQTFSKSALTVYVRALTEEELQAQRKKTEERTKDMDHLKANEQFGYDLLCLAIVAVKPAGGKRTPVTLTRDQVEDLRKAIGDTQVTEILRARMTAQSAVPDVDADFLQRRSGSETGRE